MSDQIEFTDKEMKDIIEFFGKRGFNKLTDDQKRRIQKSQRSTLKQDISDLKLATELLHFKIRETQQRAKDEERPMVEDFLDRAAIRVHDIDTHIKNAKERMG